MKGHRQTTDGVGYETEYAYNLSGAMVEQRYPSGRVVKNVLDASGDISMIQSKRNENFGFHNYAKHFTYNAAGAVTAMQFGSGLWETAQFNSRLQSTQLGLGTVSTGANLWKVDYEFGELQTNGTVDAVKNSGNIALQTLTVPGTSFVQSYTYDSLYRLTEATEKTGTTTNWSQQFGYDRYGNRTSLAQDIGGIAKNTTPAVNANTNRFTSTDFGYDANGNIVEDIDEMTSLPREFIFNGDNKQTEVKRDGVTIGRYYYDGEGRRVKKVTDTETTVFVYAVGQLIAEYSTALSQTPSVSYTTADHLGSPRVITNELGKVSSRRDFMPFGEELYAGIGNRTGDTGLKYSSSDDDIRQKFTGYQKDNETNLDFAEARMYQNLHGRFTAVDPIFIKKDRLLDPQRINLYLYVHNNPLKFVDNSGEDLILANAAARTTFRQVTRNGLSRAERNNIRILTNGRVVLRNPNAVDTQNASYAYQQIAGIIGNRNLTITVYAVAKGETAIGVSYQDAFESAGITFGSPGDAQRDVVIPVGGGVPVCANPPGSCGNPMGSGNTVATTEDTIFAHEVFGHANGNDGDDAITAENNYRRSRNPAIGERSGEDHRYTTEVTAPTELISTTPAEIQTNLVPKPMLPLPTPPPKRPE